MAHYWSSSSATLPVLAPQPSHPSDSAAASSSAPDDNPSLVLTLYEDPWKIKKVLTPSDVDGSCQLLLWTNAVEEHVLSSMGENDARLCRTGRGKEFELWDADDSSPHKLFLKKSDNTNDFVLTGNWKEEFVNRRGLNVGDMIGLAWDGAMFYFKLLNRN